jgi:hypothetical protein
MDCFAPRLVGNPLWLPAQRMAAVNVKRNRPYAHVYKAFQWTLSPMELIPNIAHMTSALRRGRYEMEREMPLIEALMKPLPGLDMEYESTPLPPPRLAWRAH